MILRPVRPRVAVRPADLEAAGRVDVIDRLVAEQCSRNDLGHDFLHIGVQLGFLLALIIALGMLGRDDDGRGGDGLAAFIAQRDLALGVRLEKGAAPEWRSAAIFSRILWL